jgi:hypothetical protein
MRLSEMELAEDCRLRVYLCDGCGAAYCAIHMVPAIYGSDDCPLCHEAAEIEMVMCELRPGGHDLVDAGSHIGPDSGHEALACRNCSYSWSRTYY